MVVKMFALYFVCVACDVGMNFRYNLEDRCNVRMTFAIWVSIQDLKKPLNTKFSIRPKVVSIMVAGCQKKNSVP